MAVHMFLKLDKATGESSSDGFKEQIEVLSWTWGMTQSGSAHIGSGTGTSGVTVGDVSIVKFVDKSTPVLMKYCCSGTFWEEAVLTVCKAGTARVPYLVVTMQKGIVTGLNSGGIGPDERLIETVSLNFKSFKVEYTTQQGDKAGPKVPMGWDIPGAKAI